MSTNGGHEGPWPSRGGCVGLVPWRDALRHIRCMSTNGGHDGAWPSNSASIEGAIDSHHNGRLRPEIRCQDVRSFLCKP